MTKIFILVLMILILKNEEKTNNAFQIKGVISDTSYLKTLRYEKLNELISYHIIKPGKFTSKKNLQYLLKTIAKYNYYNHCYERMKDVKNVVTKSKDIDKFLMTDRFSHKAGFNAIFKIRSEMAYKWRPDMLKKISIFPKNKDEQHVNLLMSKLKEEKFVNNVSLDTMKRDGLDSIMHRVTRRIYIRIKIKSPYWDIKKVEILAEKLKKWPEIEDVVYVELFTGYSKADLFYNLSSN